MTPERKTQTEILQEPTEIKIGAYTYTMQAPTLATLIMASSEISELPEFEMDTENFIQGVLKQAWRYSAIGTAIATMIIGAKRAKERKKTKLFGFIPVTTEETKAESLGRKIMNRHGCAEILELLTECVKRMECGDFFAVTTFLSGANMTKATKVVNETTAHGR